MGKQNLTDKLHCFSLTSATTLATIKARLRSNSELLEESPTLRAAKVVVLDGVSYPELRLPTYRPENSIFIATFDRQKSSIVIESRKKGCRHEKF